MIYSELLEKSREAGAEACRLAEEAEAVKMSEIGKCKDMSAWVGYTFESSSGLTPEFALFAKQFRAYVTRNLPDGIKLVSFTRGHFYVSGFILNANTGKYVYFSSDDVRWDLCGGWYKKLLIRTAKHDKDYTGGANESAPLAELSARASEMTL